MPRDYNIYFNIGDGGEKRQAFGTKNSLKTSGSLNTTRMSEDGGSATNMNLSRIVNAGLLFNLSQKANEIRGAFTEDRIQQRNFAVAQQFTQYAIGFAINPLVGATYLVGDMAYRGIMYQVNLQKQNREAGYYRELSGNNAYSGSRYRGDYV